MKTLIQKDTCTPILKAALFIIATILKQSKRPSTDGWIKKMWCVVEYYSGIKSEIMPFAATWIDLWIIISSVQFSSVAQSCPTLCNLMNCSTPGLPVHHQLPEFTQIYVHRVSDAIQPPHPLSSPSPPAPNPSQHQSLFQWVNTSHEVAKVLKFQL